MVHCSKSKWDQPPKTVKPISAPLKTTVGTGTKGAAISAKKPKKPAA